MKYSFVVNPKAGKGNGRKILERLKSEVSRRRIDADILITESRGHATDLAARCSGAIVVAVGGDGTINEVVNGIARSTKVLGILPCGSGNDLIKSLGIPTDFSAAFEKIDAGRIKEIDFATVQCSAGAAEESRNSTTHYFVNGVGIGFDAMVAERTQKTKWLGGTALYVFAVFQTLGRYVSPAFKISIDSNWKTSRNLLIAIGNGRCAGGGFYLTPDAMVDDGYLDVCMIGELSILKIVAIMPRVMKGIHQFDKDVTMKKAKEISVEAPESFFVHADGEMVGRDVNSVRVQILEKGLKVIVA